MTDTIIKGTGNSRTLRSVPNFLTLYPSYQAFAAALVNGTLPIDLGSLVAAGVQTQGTALNKANLLTDAVENAIWGNAANRTPSQALQQLRTLITTAQTAADKQKFVVGTYTGNGAASRKITLAFTPKAVLVLGSYGSTIKDSSYNMYGGLAVTGAPASESSGEPFAVKIDTNGFLVSYYKGSTAYHNTYTNSTNIIYHYLAM